MSNPIQLRVAEHVIRVGRGKVRLALNDQNGAPVAWVFSVAEPIVREQARRFAACWNACDRLTTTELEKLKFPEDAIVETNRRGAKA